MAAQFLLSWKKITPLWRARLTGTLFILGLLLAIHLITTYTLEARFGQLEAQFASNKLAGRATSNEEVGYLAEMHAENRRAIATIGLILWGTGLLFFGLGMPFLNRYFSSRQEQQKSEDRNRFLAHLLNIVDQAVIAVDLEGIITYWNHYAEVLYGWRASEAMGRSVVDLILPDDARPDAARIMEQVQKGKSWQGQFEIARRGGDRLPVLATVTPVFDEQGQTIGMVGVTTDITELQQREREMDVVVRISKALRSARTRDEMAPVIVEQVNHLLQADGVALATFHSPADELVFELGRGVLSSWTGMCISAKIPLAEEIFSQRQAYWSNDIRSDNRLAYPALWEGVKSAAIAPLMVSGERVGVLVISRPQGIDPEVIRLLSAIADIAANALNRSSLHEKTRLHAEQMATVEAIGRMLAETLDLPEIYARLSQSVFDLLPDIASLIISRFEREKGLIHCDYAVSDGEVLDTSDFPPVQLEPPGYGPQSEAIRTCQAVTVNDLQSRLQQTIPVYSMGTPLAQSALYVPMLTKGEVIGVMQVQSYTLKRFDETDRSLLSYVANAAAISIVNAGLYAELQESTMQTVLSLARAVDARDTYTADHSQRLSDWAVRIALRMGCSQSEVQDIRWAGLLHDIGKIGVPDAILSKPGPLNREEWEIMRHHPQVGEEILMPLKKFQRVAPMVGAHHERFDGMGYPRGLNGEQTPLGARILVVVDAYVAMTDDRLYRKAFGHRDAIEEMKRCSGTQFDPTILDEFLSLLQEHEVHLIRNSILPGW